MTHDLRALTVNRSKQSDPALSLLDEAREGQVSQGYIALASLVLEHAPEWVEPIEAGTKSLIDAYEIAAQRQKQALAESLPYELTRSKSMPEWEELLPICYGLQDLFRTF